MDFFKRIPLPAKLILIGLIPLIFIIYLSVQVYNEKTSNVKLSKLYLDRIHQSVDISRTVETRVNSFYNEGIKARKQALIVMILAIVLVTALIAYSIYIINRALLKLKKAAENISVGIPAGAFKMGSNDVIGKLARSIHKIEESNKTLARAADEIGKGNFNTEVRARSDEDVLGNAIVRMKNELQQFTSHLEESERRNRHLLQALPAAVYSCDANGYITLYNQSAVELWGREPELGKDRFNGAWKIFNCDGTMLEPEQYPMAIVLEGGQRFPDEELIIERPDGSRRFVISNPQPIVDAGGNISGGVNMLLDITDRKIAEKDTARLASIVQSSEDAIISKTPEGIITSWNPGAEHLFGYAAKEVIGKSITILIPPDRLGEEPLILERIRKGERVEHFDTKRVTKDGRILDISLTISPIRDSRGKIVGASKVARDITDAVMTRKKIQESEERFKTIANTAPVMIWMSGTDKFSDFFNTSWLSFTGKTIEQERGEGWLEGVHPDDVIKCTETYKESYDNQKAFSIEYRLRRHDGKFRWISDNAIPRFDIDGRFLGFISACRDIDDEKLMNEKLQESELLFKTISNVSPVGLWMTDENGQNNFVNDTWVEWTGIPMQGQYDGGWAVAIIAADKEYVIKKFKNSFTARENFHAEFRIRRRDGGVRWVLSEGSPYYDIDGNFEGFAGSIADITERKQDEMRKNEFLAVASHELKTPLTSIKAYAQLLSSKYEKTADVVLKNALSKVDNQVNKMIRLVGDFLNLSKIESERFQLNTGVFVINDLVDEVAADLQLVSEDHKIIVEKGDILKVNADSEKISQVISNLLNNAVKYSPDDKNITVSVLSENGSVKVSVSDKGIGIKPEEQDKIFQRFYRSKFNNNISFSGFGIGLYISAEIIRRHNGKIGVSSSEGKGATFYFTLPLAK